MDEAIENLCAWYDTRFTVVYTSCPPRRYLPNPNFTYPSTMRGIRAELGDRPDVLISILRAAGRDGDQHLMPSIAQLIEHDAPSVQSAAWDAYHAIEARDKEGVGEMNPDRPLDWESIEYYVGAIRSREGDGVLSAYIAALAEDIANRNQHGALRYLATDILRQWGQPNKVAQDALLAILTEPFVPSPLRVMACEALVKCAVEFPRRLQDAAWVEADADVRLAMSEAIRVIHERV